MVQGTTSDAGKSILVAGLCRVLKRKGISVAPFKPQNMALNSAVTPEGGEIGRAQALQAVACGLELQTDFNPVLLKPSSDMKSQVIIHGQVVSDLASSQFSSIKEMAFDQVLESYARLKKQFDVVLIEGAGSPAEVNLRANDIANMGFAEEVQCPVILISDIDRGGVFAHLMGTLDILSSSEKKLVKGFVINKFRGSLELLKDGLDWLEDKSNKPVLAVLPYMQDLKLDAEDAININQLNSQKTANEVINIKILCFPRISNHTDFEPLLANEQVKIEFIRDKSDLSGADLIILPGSKNVRDDLEFLKAQGWHQGIQKHCRYGGNVLGICGGFQMLGEIITDSFAVEGHSGSSEGLNLLAMKTELLKEKSLKQVSGHYQFQQFSGDLKGYEIHNGSSSGKALRSPFCQLIDQQELKYNDGAISEDGIVMGTYLHGLFENKELTESLLEWVSGKQQQAFNWNDVREAELNRLADMLEENCDINQILSMIN